MQLTAQQRGVCWSCSCVFCMQTCRETHHTEYPVQLVMMERVAGLDVLLATVEDGLRRQQLSKDATNCPNVWCKHTHRVYNPYCLDYNFQSDYLNKYSCLEKKDKLLYRSQFSLASISKYNLLKRKPQIWTTRWFSFCQQGEVESRLTTSDCKRRPWSWLQQC